MRVFRPEVRDPPNIEAVAVCVQSLTLQRPTMSQGALKKLRTAVQDAREPRDLALVTQLRAALQDGQKHRAADELLVSHYAPPGPFSTSADCWLAGYSGSLAV